MKKMFKFFMTVAAIAAISSCSNEEVLPGDGPVTSSEKATLTVQIAGGGQATRAVDDANATTDELKVSNATIFVFNAQNAYQADTTVTLSSAHEDGNNKYKVSFQVPTGNKRIYVGLNFTAAMKDSVKTKGLAALAYAINDQEDLFYVSSNSTSTNFKGNPMFNLSPVYANIASGTNTASVNVERLTAKITVIKEDPLDKGSVKASNATFSNDIKFAMGNKNIKIFPMKDQSSDGRDPNWVASNYTSYKSDFQHEFEVLGKAWNQWETSKFVPVDDDKNVDVKNRKTKYAFENTHEMAQQGEVTYVAVMVKFTPEKIATSFDGTSLTPVTVSPSGTEDSLHVVIDNNTYYYYNDKDEAQKHIDYLNTFLPIGNKTSFTTYYNQTCFYQVWLNSDPSSKEYQAKRNEYYSVGLKNISKLGSPYPEIDDPTSIIGATSSITVNITVNPWSLIDMGGTILGD